MRAGGRRTNTNPCSHFYELLYLLGLDWPNQTTSLIADPKNDSAYRYFNKYAGQKYPVSQKNAVCALKDVLDASDEVRFLHRFTEP